MPSISRRGLLARLGTVGAIGMAGCLGGRGTATYRSFGYDARNRGWHSEASGPSGSVEESWRFPPALQHGAPIVADGRVIVATRRREGQVVVALDAADGRERWSYDAGAALGPGWYPALSDGTLFFVDRTGTVHAVAADTGDEVWTRSLGARRGVPHGVVAGESGIVFGLGQLDLFKFDGLYCLEQADGSTRWHLPPAENRPHTPAFPAIGDGTVYYGTIDDPHVYARSVDDGSQQWASRPGTSGGYQSVSLADGGLYWSGAGGLAALDPDARTVTWRSEDDFRMFPPAVDGERVYHTVGGDRGVSLQATTHDGRDVWRTETVRETMAAPPLLPPTVAGGTVYYGDPRRQLRALDATTGDELWSIELENAAFGTPAVVDGTVYVTSQHGLSAFRAG